MAKLKTLKFLWTFLLLLSLSVPFSAQEYILKIDHYGIEEGLSHRDVQSVLQDKDGLLWFGTRYGLNRFDGYKFKWYTKETHGFQSNNISEILEDVNGHFWLLDTEALSLSQTLDIFNPQTESSQRFEEYFSVPPFSVSDIIRFAGNKNGELAFLTKENELYIYDGQWKSTSIQTENFTETYELRWGPNNWIWLTSNFISEAAEYSRMLQAFDLNGKQVQMVKHIDSHGLFIHKLEESGACHYILTNHRPNRSELYFLSKDKQVVQDTTIGTGLLREHLKGVSFLQGSAHEFVEKESFYLLSFNTELLLFTEDKIITPEEEPALKKIAAHAHFSKDDSGQIWAINAFGVYRIKLEKNKFQRLLYNLPEGTFAARKMSIDDHNHLWTIKEGIMNLWKTDMKSGTVSTLNQTARIQNNIPIDYTFNSIIKGHSGLLHFATRNTLTTFDPATLSYQQFDIGKNGNEVGHNVWALHEDQAGKFWYTTDSGSVGFWDGETATWISQLDSIRPPKFCYFFHTDKANNFWLATDRGLFVLDNRTGVVKKRFWSGGQGEFHLPFDNVYHFLEDEDGTFWLGTGGTGLIHWNKGQALPESDTDEPVLYRQFSRTHGLNNVIYAVYEDENKNLWLPSDNGIVRFHKNTHQINTYLESDGITHHEFNRISHLQAEDGRLFFGGLNGVTAFHPGDFLSDSISAHAPLVITDFQQFDGEGKRSKEKEAQTAEKHRIILQPDDRFFRLEFSLLTFEQMDKNLYAYKVEGIDEDWNYQKENFVRFSRLPYGESTLLIKGQGVDGQWSSAELAIQLVALKPFYLQTWFLISSFLTLIVAIFLFYKWRTRQLKKQKQILEAEVARQTEEIRQQAEELKSLEKLKSRFFANVSHELRTPLTLMLGPMNSLLKRDYWKDKDRTLLNFVNKNGRHLLKLVNEILDLSKLETNRLELKETAVNFHDYLQPMAAQFSSFGDSESVKVSFDYFADPKLNLLLDTGKFEKIVHNFLSNAIKFSPPQSEVKFTVKEEVSHPEGNMERTFLITVADRGRGIHPDDLPHIFDRFYQSKQADAPTQGGTGIGLSLATELAELLGGKIWAESEWGKGSTFYFRFPKKTVDGGRLTAASLTSIGNEGDSSGKPIPINQASQPTNTTAPEVNSGQTVSRQQSGRSPSTVLVVEDNTDLRNYIQSILEENYRVITAENGKVGYDCLLQTPDCQLIISDLMMPIMDGFQLLEKIKSNDALRHLPVIMLTARADVKVKLRALRIGVDDYMTKPFVEDELKARIHNLLKYAQARKDIFAAIESENGEPEKVEKPMLAEVDARWLEEVEKIFTQKLDEPQFKMDWVASQLHLSQRQFTRRIKKLTGMPPSQYLREIRLNTAKDFLLMGKFSTVKETCFAIGLRDTEYFSERFRQRFGVLPSTYLS